MKKNPFPFKNLKEKESRHFASKQQCHKNINTLMRLNIFSIPICDPRMPRICLAKNATFGN
jgi:hypothetical protein